MRVPLALLKLLNGGDIRLLRETRLLRVRACEGCNLMEERDVLLRQGCAIEVAHAGANVDEGRCEI